MLWEETFVDFEKYLDDLHDEPITKEQGSSRTIDHRVFKVNKNNEMAMHNCDDKEIQDEIK